MFSHKPDKTLPQHVKFELVFFPQWCSCTTEHKSPYSKDVQQAEQIKKVSFYSPRKTQKIYRECRCSCDLHLNEAEGASDLIHQAIQLLPAQSRIFSQRRWRVKHLHGYSPLTLTSLWEQRVRTHARRKKKKVKTYVQICCLDFLCSSSAVSETLKQTKSDVFITEYAARMAKGQ